MLFTNCFKPTESLTSSTPSHYRTWLWGLKMGKMEPCTTVPPASHRTCNPWANNHLSKKKGREESLFESLTMYRVSGNSITTVPFIWEQTIAPFTFVAWVEFSGGLVGEKKSMLYILEKICPTLINTTSSLTGSFCRWLTCHAHLSIQSALCICGFCIRGFKQPQIKKIFGKKNSRKFQRAKCELVLAACR